jgi:hypothetical protein
MRLRSLLFVPGDSERKFARARTADADVLILDLEDSVALSQKVRAREIVAGLLDDQTPRNWRFFVRPNPFDTGLTLADLAAVVRPGLDGVLIPKADSAADIVRIGHYLDALEEKAGIPVGTVKIAVVATETPAAMFALGSYAPRPSPPGRPHLGRRGPRSRNRRHHQQGGGRRLDAALSGRTHPVPVRRRPCRGGPARYALRRLSRP